MKKYRSLDLKQAVYENNSRYYNTKSGTSKMRRKSGGVKMCPICGKALENPLFRMCKGCYDFMAEHRNEKRE